MWTLQITPQLLPEAAYVCSSIQTENMLIIMLLSGKYILLLCGGY